jgi:hypothetical protein
MTVQELIDLLQTVKDKNNEVVIEIGVYTRAYPAAYTPVRKAFFQLEDTGTYRLYTCLPNNMYTVEKKGA